MEAILQQLTENVNALVVVSNTTQENLSTVQATTSERLTAIGEGLRTTLETINTVAMEIRTLAQTVADRSNANAGNVQVQVQQEGLKSASLSYFDGTKPLELYAWLAQAEAIARGSSIDLETPAARARIAGYFRGELQSWFATSSSTLLPLSWAAFKQALLNHYGLFTEKEAVLRAMLKLCSTRSSDYGVYMLEFNNLLAALYANTTNTTRSELETLVLLQLYRAGLPEVLSSLAAEYAGTSLEDLQAHISQRLARDGRLAQQARVADLTTPTPMDLSLHRARVNTVRGDFTA